MWPSPDTAYSGGSSHYKRYGFLLYISILLQDLIHVVVVEDAVPYAYMLMVVVISGNMSTATCL